MPLHINLLHEEQSKVVERKRDPLKLGVLALLVVAMAFYGFYLKRSLESKKIADNLTGLKTEWATLSTKAATAQTQQTEAAAIVAATASIEKIINGRFYWGPLFTDIFQGTGPEIQLTSFAGGVRSPESVTFELKGISAGNEPRAVAERFRQSMEDKLRAQYSTVTSQFNSLEDSEAPATLDGKKLSAATFSIGYQLTLTKP